MDEMTDVGRQSTIVCCDVLYVLNEAETFSTVSRAVLKERAPNLKLHLFDNTESIDR